MSPRARFAMRVVVQSATTMEVEYHIALAPRPARKALTTVAPASRVTAAISMRVSLIQNIHHYDLH